MTTDDLSLNIEFEKEEQSKPTKNKSYLTRIERLQARKTQRLAAKLSKSKRIKENVSEHESKKRKIESNDEEGSTEEPPPKRQDAGVISYIFGPTEQIPDDVVENDVVPIEEPLFSGKSFSEIKDLHPFIISNLEQNFHVTNMTQVQRMSIPELMKGTDALIRSQTGSGKTLAYALPIIHKLQEIRPKINRSEGVKVLVVLPTRELALQTYECFVKLCKSFTWLVPGVLVGGEKRKSEKARLRKGITILVGTPGRLIDHAKHTKNLSLANVTWFVLDEADRLLDLGYEQDISSLVEILKENPNNVNRQTVLLSATLTNGVQRLAGLALHNPKTIDASNEEENIEEDLVIPPTLEQKYIIVPGKLRLVTLAGFITRVCQVEGNCKMLVFMATQDMVDYYTDLFSTIIPEAAKFFKLHGNMSQVDRTQVFKAVKAAKSGVLLCTDVAARGLDLPKVHWIVQYTAPCTPHDYVHRVGRTARVGSRGAALLFVAPTELGFLETLNRKRIRITEETVDNCLECLLQIPLQFPDGQNTNGTVENAAFALQMNFEQALLDDKALHDLGCKGYQSFVRFYASYPKDLRHCFEFKKLHLGHYAKSFALRDAPTKIGGIGKPRFKKESQTRFPHQRIPTGPNKNRNFKDKKFSKNQNVKVTKTISKQSKPKVFSEFDSGL